MTSNRDVQVYENNQNHEFEDIKENNQQLISPQKSGLDAYDDKQFKKIWRKLKHVRWRWIILILSSAFCFGAFWSDETPDIIQIRVQDCFAIDETQYSLTYTIYSIPNIFLPLFGGLLTHKIGNGRALILVQTLILIGQSIVTLGAYQQNFYLYLAGRLIFGLGAETMYVLSIVYANLYFIDQEISLAMGLNCSIAYIIDFLAGILDPRIAETDDGPDRGVGLCLLVGTALCLLAFFLSIIIITLDNNAQKHDDILKQEHKQLFDEYNEQNKSISESKTKQAYTEARRSNIHLSYRQSEMEYQRIQTKEKSALVSPEDRQKQIRLSQAQSEIKFKGNESSSLDDEPEDENRCIRFDIISTFDAGYWIMCIDSLMTYAIYYAFTTFAADMLQNNFLYDEKQTGLFMTIQYPMVVILTPIIGIICDNFGKRQSILIFANILQLISFIILLQLGDCNQCYQSLIPFFQQGINLSVFEVIQWGSLSYIVEAKSLGTAYGLMTCLQNLGAAVFLPLVGWIYDTTSDEHGYFYVISFYIIMSSVCLFFKILLFIWDFKKRGGVLESRLIEKSFKNYLKQKQKKLKEKQQNFQNEQN